MRAPALLALVLATATAAAPVGAATEFHALVSGASANPPNSSNARGIGHFFLDEAQENLAYDIRFDPFVSQEAVAHIHIAAIANGGVDDIVHDLPNGPVKVGSWMIEAPHHLAALHAGHLYVNIHTASYSRGEIAGSILLGTPARPATWGRVKALYLDSTR
jgi:hypothetical protein